MKQFTQSNTDPGNCWQTAIACLLEVDPASMPDQVLIERPREQRLFDGWLSYNNALQGYLHKHHALRYIEHQAWQLLALDARPGYHIICGPTVRTEGHRARGMRHVEHCVVGKDGYPVWDVHPSRAGLITEDEWRWGCLVKVPASIQAEWGKRAEQDAGYRRIFIDCICPACFDQTVLA